MATDTKEYLEALFTKELYPTKLFLPIVKKYFTKEEILEHISYFNNQQLVSALTCLDNYNDLRSEYLSIVQPFEIPPGNYVQGGSTYTQHVVLTGDDKKLFHLILQEVLVPTVYLTPKGEKTVNYDVDRWQYIEYLLTENKLTWNLVDYINERLLFHREVLFHQNFN